MVEVEFLFSNQLIASVEKLIKESKNQLLIISPFIDLDKRIQDALKEKLSKHDFQLRVLFGKNEDNLYKSIKSDSLDFLKSFPNVEIRYNERLHAKFYLNDFDFIMTSMNLYDYSLAKNIEVGVICNYGTKGLLGKVYDSTDTILLQGVEKVKHDMLGMGKDINPIEEFNKIFWDSELKYKTKPNIVDAGGIKGMMGGKKLDGFEVIVNNLLKDNKETKQKLEIDLNSSKQSDDVKSKVSTLSLGKTQSASQLSKAFGVSQKDITELMQRLGLVKDDVITELGLSKGLVMKNYMGKDYIAYPDNLEELNFLKEKA